MPPGNVDYTHEIVVIEAGQSFQQENTDRLEDFDITPINKLVADKRELVGILGPPISKQQDSDQQNVTDSHFQPENCFTPK